MTMVMQMQNYEAVEKTKHSEKRRLSQEQYWVKDVLIGFHCLFVHLQLSSRRPPGTPLVRSINYQWKRQRKIVMWGTLAGAHGVSVFVFLCLCAGVSAYLCDLVSVCLIVSGCVCWFVCLWTVSMIGDASRCAWCPLIELDMTVSVILTHPIDTVHCARINTIICLTRIVIMGVKHWIARNIIERKCLREPARRVQFAIECLLLVKWEEL